MAEAEGWYPDLNPTQKLIFEDDSRFILAHGEKFSGKSIGCLHKVVRHCYENANALALIVAPSIRTAVEGSMYDLEHMILPAWKAGIGLSYQPPKLDPLTKDRVVWIESSNGGWSKILIIAIPYPNAIRPRLKGMAPSIIYVEELTDCDGVEYFTHTTNQLGRRAAVKGKQQFLASCNPEGPSHWVYQSFFVDCVVEEDGRVNPDGMRRDEEFMVYHVPVKENLDRPDVDRDYIEKNLAKTLTDPIERRRLLDGEWIDRPSGDAIFRDYYDKNLHVHGEITKGTGLLPQRNFPIIVGYDPGPANFSIHLMQLVPIDGKLVWLVFDELNFVGKHEPYFRVIPKLVERLEFWCKRMEYRFKFEHVADAAAFTMRDANASFESREIEKRANECIKRKGYKLPNFRLRPCPKGKGSVAERVRILQSLLMEECIYISALCTKTLDMLMFLRSKKVKEGEYDHEAGYKPMRSPQLHPFDSMTYPIVYFANRSPLFLEVEAEPARIYQTG